MVSTVGLQRLEATLHGDRAAADDAIERVQRAAQASRTPAPAPRLIETIPQRVDVRLNLNGDEPGLPTRVYAPQMPNPQFQRPRYANPV
jgi:hypothetical protein